MFDRTDELEPLTGIVGQRRAVRAIEFGLIIRKRGYNIFAVGAPGSGKTSTVRRILNQKAPRERTPPDICYIYNFLDRSLPRVLLLPSGQGQVLAKDMDVLVKELSRQIAKMLNARSLALLRAELMARFELAADRALKRLIREAGRQGLFVQQDEDRLLIAPIVGGEPIGPDEFEKMPLEVKQVLEEKVYTFQQRIASFERFRSRMERETAEAILDRERTAIEPFLDQMLAELRERHKSGGPKMTEYLDQVREFVLENHRRFVPQEEARTESNESRGVQDAAAESGSEETTELVELQVNVLVDRSRQKGTPVVFEQNPSVANLMGHLEYREQLGALHTDHTLVRPGALHRANGGYLVIQAAELLNNTSAWDALKRALVHQKVTPEESAEEGHRLAGTVKPEPVPLDVKVIFLGTQEIYSIFQANEPEFDRLFKVKADFEESMVRNKTNIRKLARFLSLVIKEEAYLPMSAAAVAEVIDFSSRLAQHQSRLSTQLSAMVDLLSESDYCARRESHRTIEASNVKSALRERRLRHCKIEDLIFDEIREGQLLIDTSGKVVGQMNGIAVYDMGDYIFGTLSRISARTYVGQTGVVNIDREVKLSGAIHDKGALILVGFLGGRFALSHPLSLSASITFEQSYEEVEGDSASATELFTLLSSLSGIPICQSIAATGSVNQQGEIQPIGSVNEKVEGVFQVCKKRGLDGRQGVIIPRANIRHLMLNEEVIEAVRKGQFHIWAISHIDQGIEILTGCPAGRQKKNGWTADSINDLVARRLQEFAKRMVKPSVQAKSSARAED